MIVYLDGLQFSQLKMFYDLIVDNMIDSKGDKGSLKDVRLYF